MHKIHTFGKYKKYIFILFLLLMAIPLFRSTSYEAGNPLFKYLEQKSLCNYEKALSIIEDWTIGLSDPAVIETNIFRINELIKYPEMIKPAINAYKKILKNKIIQENNFLKARINIFLNMLLLRKGDLREASELRSSLGFIAGFSVTAPIKNSDIEFNNPSLTAADIEKKITHRGIWFDAYADLAGRIDAGDFFEDLSDSVLFLKSEISIPADGKYSLMLGKTGHTDIWINGNRIFSNIKRHNFSYDQYNLKLELSKGRHVILVKTGDSRDGTNLALRMCDENGNAVSAEIHKSTVNSEPGIFCKLIGTSFFNSLENIINTRPSQGHPAFDTGYLYFASGINSEEDKEAIKLFSEVKESELLSAANYYTGLLEQVEWQKNYFYNESIRSYNKSIEAIKGIADLKLINNLIYDVYPLVEKIMEINPRSEQALELKARAFMLLGWHHEALRKAKDMDMKSHKYGTESLVHIKKRKYKEALNACLHLYEIDRFNMSNLNNLLECYLKTGRFEEADGVLSQCAELYPNNVSLRLKHAELMKNIYGAEKALPYLLCARKISPYNNKVLLNTGLAYHKLNKDDLAKQYLQKALVRSPENEWLKQYLENSPLNPPEGDLKNKNSHPTSIPTSSALSSSKELSPPEGGLGVESADKFLNLEKEIFRNYYAGNQLELYNSIERLLIAFPAEPVSVMYYNNIAKLAHFRGYEKAQGTLRRLIDSVSCIENSPEKNMRLISLKLVLERLLYRFDRNEAEKLSAEFFPLKKWSILGPYSKYGAYDIDFSFMPEITTNLKSAEIKKKEIYVRDPAGIVNLKKYINPENSVAYAVTTIACAHSVKVRIYAKCPYKLFINGKEAIKNLKSDIYRTCRVVRVWGSPKITLMIKLSVKVSRSDFRIFITDGNNKILNIDSDPLDMVFFDFNFLEEMDYPYNHFAETGSLKEHNDGNDADFRLAGYFHELGSSEAVKYYRNAIANDPDNPVKSCYYANCLIEMNGGDNESASFLEGISILENLAKRYPDFIPAQQIRINKLIESKNFDKAYSDIQKLSEAGRKYLPLRLNYAGLLLQSGYEKEFETEINALEAEFPHSIQAMLIAAEYYRQRDVLKSAELYKKILSIEVCDKALNELISIYGEQGNYREIAALAEVYDSDGKFTNEKTDALIDSGNYSAAKNTIFQELTRKNDPYYNAKLGEIAYLEGYDPSMYWQKALSINPSNFKLKEFMDYINSGRIEYPFKAYRNDSIDAGIVFKDAEKLKNKSSHILNRSVIFLLNEDRGARVMCEDSVLLTYPEAAGNVRQLMEHGSIISGEIQPVSIRSIPINTMMQEIPPNSPSLKGGRGDLKEGFILQISYFINNPDIKPRGSAFFATPYIKIQDLDERVSHFSLTVIAPEKLKVRFSFNRDIDIKSSQVSGITIYKAELNNAKGESAENTNPSAFAFSTMNDMTDFALWYAGQIKGAFNTEQYSLNPGSANKPPDELIKSVFDFASNDIETKSNILCSPRKAKDTLFKKRGSIENKAILAASILAEFGIKSYIAFTGNEYKYDGYFISPYIFTNILLYVPLDIKTGLWMDFSDKRHKCGNVDSRLIGRDAVVIIKGGYEIKKINVK